MRIYQAQEEKYKITLEEYKKMYSYLMYNVFNGKEDVLVTMGKELRKRDPQFMLAFKARIEAESYN